MSLEKSTFRISCDVSLQSIVVRRPEPTTRAEQHMCVDKGYDYLEVHELLEDYGYATSA